MKKDWKESRCKSYNRPESHGRGGSMKWQRNVHLPKRNKLQWSSLSERWCRFQGSPCYNTTQLCMNVIESVSRNHSLSSTHPNSPTLTKIQGHLKIFFCAWGKWNTWGQDCGGEETINYCQDTEAKRRNASVTLRSGLAYVHFCCK